MARRPRFRRLVQAVFLIGVAAVAAGPAISAKDPVELVLMVGVRGGEDLEASVPGVPPATANPSLSFGLAVDVLVRPDGWFEAFVDHQTLRFRADSSAFATKGFDFAIDYLQFGGGYEPPEGRVRPFVTAAVGLTRYGASWGEVKSTIGASGSLGGGFKVPVGKSVSFRFEVRGYATFTDAAVSVACGPGCFVQFGANGWYQFAARAGVSIRL